MSLCTIAHGLVLASSLFISVANSQPPASATARLQTDEFTCLRVGASDADIRIEVFRDTVSIRKFTLLHFSRAGFRYCVHAREPVELRAQVTKTDNSATPLPPYSFEPVRQATRADASQVAAQDALSAARALASDTKSGIEVGRAAFQNAAGLWSAASDSYQLATTYKAFGDYLAARAEAMAAVTEFKRAIGLFVSGGWDFETAMALQNLGAAQTQISEYREAVESRTEALRLYRKLTDRTGEAYATHGRAETWWRMGLLQSSLNEYGKALGQWRALQNRAMEAQTWNALGLVNAELGRDTVAASNYHRAMTIWKSSSNRAGLLMTINNQGLLEEQQGSFKAARAAFGRALAMALEINDQRSRAYVLQNIGDTWADEHQPSKAAVYYRQSIELKAPLHDVQAEAESHRKLGLALLAMRSLTEAQTELYTGLQMARSISDRGAEAQSLAALAAFHSSAGDIAEAAADMAKAISFVETTRLELRGRGLRTSFFATKLDFYEEAIDLALKPGGGGVKEAFEWSERSRARAMVDRATAGGDQPFGSFRTSDVQSGLLDANDVLVEYSIGRHRALAFVVTPTSMRVIRLGSPREITHALPLSRDRLAAAIWWPITTPGRTRRVIIAAPPELSRVPFAALPLNAEAFAQGGPLLIDRFEIVTIPSAFFVLARRGGAASNGVAMAPPAITVFADPIFSSSDSRLRANIPSAAAEQNLTRLRFSLEEAKSLQQFAPRSTQLFTGSEASAGNFRKALAEQGSVLHIATHTAGNPSGSSFVFSRFNEDGQATEGEVTMEEIYGLNTQRALVVLAGCRTAQGRNIRGEGVASLAQAFLYSGARGLIATLWDVDDRLTADLTKSFYDGLLRRGLRPAAALRAAQLKILDEHRKQRSQNQDWAAFVFSGDWSIPGPNGVT